MKYLSINLMKYTQDLYEENYKTLMKEIKELKFGELFHVHGQEDSILSRCQFFLTWQID